MSKALSAISSIEIITTGRSLPPVITDFSRGISRIKVNLRKGRHLVCRGWWGELHGKGRAMLDPPGPWDLTVRIKNLKPF
jgi:hypothetical protein